jgi:ubiquinone/menaquinone biosynthesis C-methylase UbiE
MKYTQDPFLRTHYDRAAGRYREMHGKPPPPGFLLEFDFYINNAQKARGSISYRRLMNLGAPRAPGHPAIMSELVKKGGVLVDAGCGSGDDTRWFQKNGYGDRVTGVDLSIAAFELGYAFYEDGESRLPAFMRADVCDMPIESGSVDTVYSGSLIHGLDSAKDVGRFISEAGRIIRPGGLFFGNTLGSEEYNHKESFNLQLRSNELRDMIGRVFRIETFDARPMCKGNPLFRAYFAAVKE